MNVHSEIVAIHHKLDAVLTILKGGHDNTGRFNPGLSPRLDLVETRIAKLEDSNARAEGERLTLARGAGLAVFGGVVSQALNWIKDHAR